MKVRIGGQAVMEGVMMKNEDRYAVSVRKPDGEIENQDRTVYEHIRSISGSEAPGPAGSRKFCGVYGGRHENTHLFG